MKAKDFTAQDFRDFSFKYHVNTDYDNVRHCTTEGCDGICRCSTIVNLRITGTPSVETVVEALFRYKNKSEILAYCLDRLFRLNKMEDVDNFSANTTRGYYGEEVGDIEFHGHNAVANKIEALLKVPDDKKLEHILLEEYGEILPKMKGLKYYIKEVKIDDVKLPNRDYLMKVDASRVEAYKQQSGEYPICVCMKEGQFYTLLDGYHRLSAWKKLNHKKVKIFSGE